MIGNFRFRLKSISEASMQDYQKIYCSICHSLKVNYGITKTILTNNLVSFLLYSISDYINGDIKKTNCPSHLLLTKKNIVSHKAVNKAADVCVVLSALKLFDMEKDNSILFKPIRLHLEKNIPNLSNELISAYNEFLLVDEKTQKTENLLHTSKKFGEISFNYIADDFSISNELRETYEMLFGQIAQLIFISDCLIDINADMLKSNFNPIVRDSEIFNDSISTVYLRNEEIFSDLKGSILNIIANSITSNTHQNDLRILIESVFEYMTIRISISKRKFLNLNEESLTLSYEPVLGSCFGGFAARGECPQCRITNMARMECCSIRIF